ncbi:hypothetical protein F5X96DRAFT_674610 [Biscogniauxia mediterranea]|nr:hypothetical protein F5X96DRAFT_674610 [Biscogniauxia mediterranea]
MGCWGRGLFQNDDDLAIAANLDTMLDLPLSSVLQSPAPSSPSPSAVAHQLDAPVDRNSTTTTTLLASKLDKVLAAGAPLPFFAPHQRRERVAVVLAVLGMRAGARLEGRHRDALRVLRRALPTLEQQVQLVAALDGYEDGIPHSADEKPTSDMCSTSCFSCADDDKARLLRCARCKMARYCSAACQRMDWPIHKRVCVPRA